MAKKGNFLGGKILCPLAIACQPYFILLEEHIPRGWWRGGNVTVPTHRWVPVPRIHVHVSVPLSLLGHEPDNPTGLYLSKPSMVRLKSQGDVLEEYPNPKSRAMIIGRGSSAPFAGLGGSPGDGWTLEHRLTDKWYLWWLPGFHRNLILRTWFLKFDDATVVLGVSP